MAVFNNYLNVVVLMISICFNNITFWSPESIVSHFSTKNIYYVISNFGYVPYGHTVYGTLYLASPLDACTELSYIDKKGNNSNLIILVTRGECHFSQKVLNAQNAGAKFVIIADNNNEDVNKILPIEKSREISAKIKIPSIILSYEDSVKLIESVRAGNNIELSIYFDIKKADNISNTDLYLEIENYSSLNFIKNLQQYYNIFKDHMNIKFIYRTFTKANLSAMGYVSENDISCYNEYCIYNIVKTKNNSMKIKETIRQFCLSTATNKDNYFNYISKFVDEAFSEKTKNEFIIKEDFYEIGDKIFNKLTIDTVTKNCISNPFGYGFKESIFQNNFQQINYLPLLYINGFSFSANLDVNNYVETFCDSFVKKPSECSNYQVNKVYDNENYLIFTLKIVVFLFFCVLIILTFYYFNNRRLLRKNINNIIDDRIKQVLTNYYDENNTKESNK